MKKLLVFLVMGTVAGTVAAQIQFNPQLGLTLQTMTDAPADVAYKGAVGWQLGADVRFGDRSYFQPGIFLNRNATVFSSSSNTFTFEEDVVRTNLRLRAMLGYRIIDSYQFDLRFAFGPSYDVLMGVNRGDLGFSRNDFNNGSFNLDAGLGFDMGYFTMEPGASFGLSRVFTENPQVKDITSRYITYGLTIGVNIGNDDN
jgi:hypothetical protein